MAPEGTFATWVNSRYLHQVLQSIQNGRQGNPADNRSLDSQLKGGLSWIKLVLIVLQRQQLCNMLSPFPLRLSCSPLTGMQYCIYIRGKEKRTCFKQILKLGSTVTASTLWSPLYSDNRPGMEWKSGIYHVYIWHYSLDQTAMSS